MQAFEDLFREFQGEVYGWIVRLVRDRTTAEDLTVETFLRIHRAHARFDASRQFGPWARKIATHTALDHMKKARQDSHEVEELAAPPAPDPVVRREVQERVRQAFRLLPVKYRVTATLALIEERPYAEIAEALGTSVGTVKSRVARAQQLLRTKLTNLGMKP